LGKKIPIVQAKNHIRIRLSRRLAIYIHAVLCRGVVPPHHFDDEADSGQVVVNKEVFLSRFTKTLQYKRRQNSLVHVWRDVLKYARAGT